MSNFLDNVLKRFFTSSPPLASSSPCPEPEALFGWVAGHLDDETRESVVQHASSCARCTQMANEAVQILFEKSQLETGPKKGPESGPSQRVYRNIERHLTSKKRLPASKRIVTWAWFLGFVLFFVGSLFVKRYFFQALLLATICALQWILSMHARHLFIRLHAPAGQPNKAAKSRMTERWDSNERKDD